VPGGVARLVYMCAFALPEGGSMVGKVREFGHEELLPLAFGFAEDQSVDCRDPRMVLVGEGGTVGGEGRWRGIWRVWCAGMGSACMMS
jgi:hypothetical protein